MRTTGFASLQRLFFSGILLLLSACTSFALLAPSTATSLPADPTPAVPPTPLPDPQFVVRAYLDKWIEEDFLTMYSWLTPLSQETISLDDFEAVYQQLGQIMTLKAVSYEILSTFAQGKTAQVAYRVTLQTILVGEITRDTVMALSLEQGLWRIKWDRSLILPELNGSNSLSMEYYSPARGNIYDRNGKALVSGDTNAVSLGIIVGQTDPSQEENLFYQLWLLTGREPEEIQDDISRARAGWYVPVSTVPAAMIEAQFDVLDSFEGLVMAPFTSRYYADGGIAPHALGYVSLIQPGEVTRYQALGYRSDDRVGQMGLEKWGEPYLAGERGGALYVVSPEGQRITLLAERQAQGAGSIYTTIDRSLQAQLQQALVGFTGALVVLERDTGRVLAMVSSPGYDPNVFEPTNFSNDFILSNILTDPKTPLLNRATQGQYPLGSVFKIITMAAGLESQKYGPSSTYYCGHYFTEIPGVSRADWTVAYQVPPSGSLNLREGLMRSCNPWFWHIGLSLYNAGEEALVHDLAVEFGFGQATGIEQLVETSGNIPHPDSQIDAINYAIGQGETLVTPLQVARFVAAIGSGSDILRPQIVEQVISPNGEIIYAFERESLLALPIQSESLQAIQQAMGWVVNQQRGTAYFRFINLDIPIAGKTGTAEAPPGDPHAWFAGYTDANTAEIPDIAIAVILEHAGEGSQVAAPLFRRAVEIYFYGQPRTLLPWETELPADQPASTDTP